MDFKALFSFLEDLQQNNTKEWMDQHRKRYHILRNEYIEWLDHMNDVVSTIDEGYHDTPGKKGINRINNNLMFHPNKPIYKDHFGAILDKAPNHCDFYIHLGLSECFLAGGFYRPPTTILKSIREAIDYNGEVFEEILNQPSFKTTFGELMEDEKLRKPPKGFTQDHPHIELLKNKSFAVMRPLKRTEVYGTKYESILIETYKEMLPFRNYLNQAVTV